MFLTIVLEVPKERMHNRALHIAAHSLCWGVPMLLIIPPLVEKKVFFFFLSSCSSTFSYSSFDGVKMRYRGMDNWCFVDTWDRSWIFGIFFIPVICFVSVGNLMIGSVIVRMFLTGSVWRVGQTTIRMIVYLLISTFSYWFALGVQLWDTKNTDDTNGRWDRWIQCFMYGLQETCKIDNNYPYSMHVAYGLNTPIASLVYLLVFGTNPDILRHWGKAVSSMSLSGAFSKDKSGYSTAVQSRRSAD
jgi:hypothetical protein